MNSKRTFATIITNKGNEQGIIVKEIRNETKIGIDDFIAELVFSPPIDDLIIGSKIVLDDHDYLVTEIISPTIVKVRFAKNPDFTVHNY